MTVGLRNKRATRAGSDDEGVRVKVENFAEMMEVIDAALTVSGSNNPKADPLFKC